MLSAANSTRAFPIARKAIAATNAIATDIGVMPLRISVDREPTKVREQIPKTAIKKSLIDAQVWHGAKLGRFLVRFLADIFKSPAFYIS